MTGNGKLKGLADKLTPLPVVTSITKYQHISNRDLSITNGCAKMWGQHRPVFTVQSVPTTHILSNTRYPLSTNYMNISKTIFRLHTQKYNYRLHLIKCIFCNLYTTTVHLHKTFITCHAIAVHNLNHNHTKHLHTPSIPHNQHTKCTAAARVFSCTQFSSNTTLIH